MRTGHRGRSAAGMLERVPGTGLILKPCPAAMTAGLVIFSAGVTAVSARRKEEKLHNENLL